MAVGDFNGDGLMDVAVGVTTQFGASGVTGVYVFFGQANGTLECASVMIVRVLESDWLGFAADLNGDGRTDLVIADQGGFFPGTDSQVNGALHVYLGNAGRHIYIRAAVRCLRVPRTTSVIGEVGVSSNGDGKADLDRRR